MREGRECVQQEVQRRGAAASAASAPCRHCPQRARVPVAAQRVCMSAHEEGQQLREQQVQTLLQRAVAHTTHTTHTHIRSHTHIGLGLGRTAVNT
jgi:hypothetical protein